MFGKNMQNLPMKDWNQTTAVMAHELVSTELKKHSVSKNVAAKAYGCGKDSGFQFQGLDAAPTLSTCQYRNAVPSKPRSKSSMENAVTEPGGDEGFGRYEDSCLTSCVQYENGDYEMHQAELAFSQSMGCLALPWTQSYYGGFIATHRPNAVIYPQMMGMTSGRVPLPLECAESFPIYVNAKQYRAILRRREVRAKHEAQNKHTASRKPYLHESRHLHAIKRARGSGGRFLKTKTIQQSRPSSPAYFKYESHDQLGVNLSHSEFQPTQSSSWDASTPSASDVTSIFSGDVDFQQPKFNILGSPFHISATMPVHHGFHHGRT